MLCLKRALNDPYHQVLWDDDNETTCWKRINDTMNIKDNGGENIDRRRKSGGTTATQETYSDNHCD